MAAPAPIVSNAPRVFGAHPPGGAHPGGPPDVIDLVESDSDDELVEALRPMLPLQRAAYTDHRVAQRRESLVADVCRICLCDGREAPLRAMFLPCRHACVCGVCAGRLVHFTLNHTVTLNHGQTILRPKEMKCPMCNEVAEVVIPWTRRP